MQCVTAVVSKRGVDQERWFQEQIQRITKFERVQIVLDVEFGPGDFFRRNMATAEFAEAVGGNITIQAQTEYSSLQQAAPHVFTQSHSMGTLGSLALKSEYIEKYNASRSKLQKAPYNSAQAKEQLTYKTISWPVQTKVVCAAFRVLHLEDQKFKNEDFIFPFYFFETSGDDIDSCHNDEALKEQLRYMAQIWCLLLRKAERVYSWGTVDITLPLEWFVLHKEFGISNQDRKTLLKKLGWKLHESDSNNEKVFTAEYNSTCTTNNSVFHSLPFFSKQKKLQNAANVILGQQSETRKLLTFDEFELFYALLLHMSLVKKVPDTHSSDTLLTFSGFDRQCEAIAQHSLLQYVHRDVVLVCKILQYWAQTAQNLSDTDRLKKIIDSSMEHFCATDTHMTLVFYVHTNEYCVDETL